MFNFHKNSSNRARLQSYSYQMVIGNSLADDNELSGTYFDDGKIRPTPTVKANSLIHDDELSAPILMMKK